VTEWIRTVLAEKLADLTSPQAVDAFEDVLNAAERNYLGGLLAPEEELGPMVKAFGGTLYYNLAQLRHAYCLSAMDRLTRPLDLIRVGWRHLRAPSIIRRHHATTDACVRRLTGIDPARLSDFEVWSVIDQWFGEAPKYMEAVLLFRNGLVIDAFPFDRFTPSAEWRERVLTDVARSLDALRDWQLALADRFVERGWLRRRGDFFLLQLREIAPIVNGEASAATLRAIVKDRCAEQERARA